MAFSISYIYQVIDKFSGPLNGINTANKKFRRSMKKTQATTKRLSNNLLSVGTTAGTVASMIGGKAALDKYTGFEEAMNVARGTTRATDADFLKLQKRAKELGISTQFTSTNVARAMDMLGRNGLVATQILNGATDATLKLGAATGADLANAADIATDAMANFGIKSNEMGKAVDRIAGVTINSKFNIDDYRLALAQAGGVAGGVGVKFDDFNTAIAAVAPLFSSGSDAGTSYKTFLQRLVPQSKEAAEVMKAVGLATKDGKSAFFDATGKMKGMGEISELLKNSFSKLNEQQLNYVASTVFGTDAMRFAIGMSKAGADKFKELSNGIKEVSAQKLAEDRMRGLTGALKKLNSAMEGLLIAVFESGLADIITNVSESITNLSRTISEADPRVLKIVGVLAALTAVVVPLLTVVGIAAAGLSAFFGLFSVAVAAPVLAIAAAFGAVAAAVYQIWENWALLKEDFGWLADKAKEFGGGVMDKIKGAGKKMFFRSDIQTPEQEYIAMMRGGGIAAQENKVKSQLNGSIQVSAGKGSTIDSAGMDTDMPGNLGFNLAYR